MKFKSSLKLFFFISIINSPVVFSDVIIKSPFGTELIFSDKINKERYDPNTWEKLLFKGNGDVIDLGIKGRYFSEDGSSKLSPSGRYLVVNSMSGGYLYSEDGKKEYIDKSYCSIVDMKNGCYISDWDGEACGYEWKKNEDILENSAGSETFDFLSFRPTIMDVKNNLSSLNETTVKRYLRCDAPGQKNINTYQALIKVNKASRVLATEYIVKYIRGVTTEKTIMAKSYLFSSPDENSQTSSYLVPGDNVKVIQNYPGNKWVNIGYINARGVPLVAWIMADSLGK